MLLKGFKSIVLPNILFSGSSFLRSIGKDGSAIPPIDLNVVHFDPKTG
jgi:hypothetical protein